MQIQRALSLVAATLLSLAGPHVEAQHDSRSPSGPEWRVADRFRLFDKATDQRAEVAALLDLLENPRPSLSDRYDDFLGVISDKETGYARSAALRNSNYRKSEAGRPGRYDPSYLYPQTYWLEVRDLTRGASRCSYRSSIGDVEGACNKWTRIAVLSGDRAGRFAGARGAIAVAGGGSTPATLNYRFDDVLVVALGDSFISGEGNPDVPSLLNADPANPIFSRPSWGDKIRKGNELAREAQWWDTPCHRSLLSWTVLSTLTYAARNPQQAVSLVHLGCSGAVIDDLVERGQTDLPGGGKESESQIAQLTKLLRAAPTGWTPRSPDRVLLSIGGNDIGFVGVLTALTLPPNGFTVGPVATRLVGKEARAVCPYRSTGKPLSRLCRSQRSAEDRLEDLSSSYRRLAESLGDLGVTADRVHHAQYPNPLICAGGRPCDNNPRNGWSAASADGTANGFEALMGVLKKQARGPRFRSWNFEIQYYPEKDLKDASVPVHRLLYSELPNVRCDNTPEPTDSEVCQALLVHFRLNHEVKTSGFRTISGHVEAIQGHGLIEGSALGLSLPTAQGGHWRFGKSPDQFEPYARNELGRWFRLPNDSIMTQFHFYGDERRFHQGTVHPTYRAHLAYAEAVLSEALSSNGTGKATATP